MKKKVANFFPGIQIPHKKTGNLGFITDCIIEDVHECTAADQNIQNDAVILHRQNSVSDIRSNQTQISGWYGSGTEVVFSCGGSMFQSVKSAAAEHEGAKIIGVDNDQSVESDRVITSAVKGLSASVQIVLDQFYSGKWDSELAAKTQKLGAAEDSTGLPTDTWSMKNFTIEQYKALFEKIKKGEIVPNSETPENANNADWLNKAGFTNTTVEFE